VRNYDSNAIMRGSLQSKVPSAHEGTRVTEYVRRWRDDGGKDLKAAFIQFKFEFGEAVQFDWSEESLFIGGVYRKTWPPTPSCAPDAPFTSRPTRRRAMKCSSTPTPGRYGPSVAFRGAASTTT
jgi:hypothetical protein